MSLENAIISIFRKLALMFTPFVIHLQGRLKCREKALVPLVESVFRQLRKSERLVCQTIAHRESHLHSRKGGIISGVRD